MLSDLAGALALLRDDITPKGCIALPEELLYPTSDFDRRHLKMLFALRERRLSFMMCSFAPFLYDMIAVTRNQKWLLIGYAAAAVTIFFLAPAMVQQSAMTGAILSSIIAIFLLDLILGIILTVVIRKKQQAGKEQV